MTAARNKSAEPSKLADFLKRAQIHLDAHEIDKAKMIVKSALIQWPAALRLHLMNAEILEAEGHGPQAIVALHRTVDRFPNHLQPTTALAHACLRMGQVDDARAALALAKGRGLDEDAALRLELLIAKTAGTWPDAARSAEKIVEREAARLAQILLALAQARLQLEDAAGAEDAALRALANDPKLVQAALVAAHAAAELGHVERMVSHYRRLCELMPDDARWPLKIVTTLSVGGRYREAVQELEAVLARWPANALVRKFLQRSPLGGTFVEAAIRAVPDPEQAADDEAGEEDGSELKIKRVAAQSAAIARVHDVTRQEIAALRMLHDRGPADSQLLRPAVIDNLADEVLIGERKGAETAVFVFTAVNDRMWMPLPMFDRYLAALGVSAVYLKDFQRLLHLNGVQSIADSYAGTVAALRDLAARLGARRLCAVGHSGGARAAIRYGVELGAEAIVSFGGATGRTPCLMGTDRQFNGIIWKRALQNIPEQMLDLKPFLAAREHGSRIELVFGEDIASEKADALYLEGLPGITLHPVADATHDIVLRSLAQQDDFGDRLARLLGVELAPAAAVRRA